MELLIYTYRCTRLAVLCKEPELCTEYGFPPIRGQHCYCENHVDTPYPCTLRRKRKRDERDAEILFTKNKAFLLEEKLKDCRERWKRAAIDVENLQDDVKTLREVVRTMYDLLHKIPAFDNEPTLQEIGRMLNDDTVNDEV